MAEPSEKVFYRKATGLTKSISAHDAFIINLLGLAPTAALSAVLLVVPSLYPGADVTVAFLLITPIALAYAANYVALSSVMPRSGGDYVFNGRILHPLFGVFAGAMFWVTVTVEIGVLSGFAVGWYLAPALAMSFPGNAAVNAFAEALAGPWAVVAVGSGIIAFFTLVPILGTTIWLRVLRIIYYACVLSMIVALGACIPYSNSSFVAAFNSYASAYSITYEGVLAEASAYGWSSPAFSWAATGMAVVYMVMFLTSTWVVFVGGEVREGGKNLPTAIWWSTVLAIVVCVLNSLLYFRVVPSDFTSALVYLSKVGGDAYLLPFEPTLGYLLGILTGSPLVSFIVGFGVFFWTLSWLPNMNVMGSRVIFAWAFDGIIPRSLASVHSRRGTPIPALILMGLLAEVALMIAAFTDVVGVLMNISVMILMCYIWTGFAAALLPFRRKDVFELAPSYVRRKILGVPWVTLTGLVHGFGFVALLILLTLAYPEIGGPVTPLSMGFIASVLVGAAVLYFGARWYRLKKEGVDIDWAFKQIPPA